MLSDPVFLAFLYQIILYLIYTYNFGGTGGGGGGLFNINSNLKKSKLKQSTNNRGLSKQSKIVFLDF